MSTSEERAVQAEMVEQWNAKHPVGTRVTVKTLDGNMLKTQTRSKAWLFGGEKAVVKVDGIKGSYPLLVQVLADEPFCCPTPRFSLPYFVRCLQPNDPDQRAAIDELRGDNPLVLTDHVRGVFADCLEWLADVELVAEPNCVRQWREVIKQNMGDTFYCQQQQRRANAEPGSLDQLTAEVLDWLATATKRGGESPRVVHRPSALQGSTHPSVAHVVKATLRVARECLRRGFTASRIVERLRELGVDVIQSDVHPHAQALSHACYEPANWQNEVRAAAMEEVAVWLEKRADFYPEDVFPQEGKSRDAIAGSVMRGMLPRLAQALRNRIEQECQCEQTEPTKVVVVRGNDDAHDGAGWYYYEAEYPEEGTTGAFATRHDAVAHAQKSYGKVVVEIGKTP